MASAPYFGCFDPRFPYWGARSGNDNKASEEGKKIDSAPPFSSTSSASSSRPANSLDPSSVLVRPHFLVFDASPEAEDFSSIQPLSSSGFFSSVFLGTLTSQFRQKLLTRLKEARTKANRECPPRQFKASKDAQMRQMAASLSSAMGSNSLFSFDQILVFGQAITRIERMGENNAEEMKQTLSELSDQELEALMPTQVVIKVCAQYHFFS